MALFKGKKISDLPPLATNVETLLAGQKGVTTGSVTVQSIVDLVTMALADRIGNLEDQVASLPSLVTRIDELETKVVDLQTLVDAHELELNPPPPPPPQFTFVSGSYSSSGTIYSGFASVNYLGQDVGSLISADLTALGASTTLGAFYMYKASNSSVPTSLTFSVNGGDTVPDRGNFTKIRFTDKNGLVRELNAVEASVWGENMDMTFQVEATEFWFADGETYTVELI